MAHHLNVFKELFIWIFNLNHMMIDYEVIYNNRQVHSIYDVLSHIYLYEWRLVILFQVIAIRFIL